MSSSPLLTQSCTACRPDSKPVSSAEQLQLLKQLPGWRISEVDQIQQLSKTYSFPNFISAMAFATAVGELAESVDHHPAITIEWGKADVTWWTHAIGGLHLNDFILAAKSDSLFSSYQS